VVVEEGNAAVYMTQAPGPGTMCHANPGLLLHLPLGDDDDDDDDDDDEATAAQHTTTAHRGGGGNGHADERRLDQVRVDSWATGRGEGNLVGHTPQREGVVPNGSPPPPLYTPRPRMAH